MPINLSLRSVASYFGAGSLLSQLPISGSPFSSSTAPVSSNIAYTPFSLAPNCPSDAPVSCQNSPVGGESCCFIYPGGLFLQTQFWDTNPAIGPKDSWTLHGLWPDLCDGTYEQFCTAAPRYYNITQILESAGQTELLDYMSSYWLPNRGSAEHFWQHEWNKHGTCINTLRPSCYGDDYSSGLEVIDFFTRSVGLFKTLDTYAALAAAGITPSNTRRYTKAEIQNALTAVTGSPVVLGCQRGALNQAWYSYNVKGSLQTGDFIPTDPPGSGRGSCPTRGIRYLPKH